MPNAEGDPNASLPHWKTLTPTVMDRQRTSLLSLQSVVAR